MLSKRHQRKTRPKRSRIQKDFLFSRPLMYRCCWCSETMMMMPDLRSKKTTTMGCCCCCCCCCCCWSSSSFTSFTQHAKRLSSIVSNWKKRAFARDLLSAPRDSTIDFGRRKKRIILLTRIQKNEAPTNHLWAKDDGVVPRRPSWRPVRRTRLAGRTRARRRPVCTLLFDE